MNRKKANTVLIVLAFFCIIILFPSIRSEPPKDEIFRIPEGTGTAVILTGAAARIPQQAALLEELYNRGQLKDVVFISGVSAGALNAVVLNAILSNKMTWDEYRKILFSLQNDDIFQSQEEGRRLPVNTESLHSLLTKIVEDKLGYHQIGDLPFMTEISFTSRLRKNVYRMGSRKINSETDTTLSLVDIMMASSAIPIAFPPVRIENVKTIPDVEFIDGGVGSDYIPYTALLEFQKYRKQKVGKVFIIGRKQGFSSDLDEELKMLGINNRRNYDRLGPAMDNLLRRHLLNKLEAFARGAPDMIYKTYVWIPDFEQDFLMFNFSKMEEQYTLTKSWAQVNDPVPLGDFLLYNKLKKKE
jgi:predicted acylesterase/phospholipase RssA